MNKLPESGESKSGFQTGKTQDQQENKLSKGQRSR